MAREYVRPGIDAATLKGFDGQWHVRIKKLQEQGDD